MGFARFAHQCLKYIGVSRVLEMGEGDTPWFQYIFNISSCIYVFLKELSYFLNDCASIANLKINSCHLLLSIFFKMFKVLAM